MAISLARQVEMVGDIIHGDIVDGDTIELSDWRETAGRLLISHAFNRSLDGEVAAESRVGLRNLAVVQLVFGVIFLIAFLGIFGFAMTMFWKFSFWKFP
jgi:hypothetical protein